MQFMLSKKGLVDQSIKPSLLSLMLLESLIGYCGHLIVLILHEFFVWENPESLRILRTPEIRSTDLRHSGVTLPK